MARREGGRSDGGRHSPATWQSTPANHGAVYGEGGHAVIAAGSAVGACYPDQASCHWPSETTDALAILLAVDYQSTASGSVGEPAPHGQSGGPHGSPPCFWWARPSLYSCCAAPRARLGCSSDRHPPSAGRGDRLSGAPSTSRPQITGNMARWVRGVLSGYISRWPRKKMQELLGHQGDCRCCRWYWTSVPNSSPQSRSCTVAGNHATGFGSAQDLGEEADFIPNRLLAGELSTTPPSWWNGGNLQGLHLLHNGLRRNGVQFRVPEIGPERFEITPLAL